MQNQVKYQVSAQFCRVFLYKAIEGLDVEMCPVTTVTRGGMIRMARTYPWKVSDAFWERVKPLLPTAPSHAKGGRPRMDDRRAVERTHSWINRSRRLLVRWEKKGENYLAFLHLACAQLIFAKALVFG
jgi:hypothetical protein